MTDPSDFGDDILSFIDTLDDLGGSANRIDESMCNGICLRGSDIGIYVAGDPVAYPHPECLSHGAGDGCKDCGGWGNFAGRESEDSILTCPMCAGTGVVASLS